MKLQLSFLLLLLSGSAWAQQDYTLDIVTTVGGSVSSSPTGIVCGTTCSATYAQGADVELLARQDRGFQFAGWTGDCAGGNKTTTITLNSNARCYAVFTTVPPDGMVQIAVAAFASNNNFNISCATHQDSRASCWGANDWGRLGRGSSGDCRDTGVDSCGIASQEPVYVSGLSTVVSVGPGISSTFAALADGEAMAWGYGAIGAAGDGVFVFPTVDTPIRTFHVPVRVATTQSVVQISGGYGHACALVSNGEVYCWGWGGLGRLGQLLTDAQGTGTPIRVPGISTAVAMDLGADSGCVVLADGGLVCWGGSEEAPEPARVFSRQITTAVGLAVGATAPVGDTTLAVGNQKCVLLADDTLECWGSNQYGQAGAGSSSSYVGGPTPVVGISTAVRRVSAGHHHTCAVLESGVVKCWGRNNDGQLGDGTTTNANRAVAVLGISTAVDVSAGESHTCAVLENGFAKCWGRKAFTSNVNPVGGGGSANALGNGAVTYAGTTSPVTVITPNLALNDTIVTQTAIVGSLFAFTPSINGLALNWSIENKPAWVAFSTKAGTLYGVPSVSAMNSDNIFIHAHGMARVVLPTSPTPTLVTRPTTATYGPFSLLVESSTRIDDADDRANEIAETATVGTPVSNLSLRAVDGEGNPLTGFTWELLQNPGTVFAIDQTSGEISLAAADVLDYETSASRTVVVGVQLGGSSLASMTVTIEVQDVLEVSDTNDSANTIVESAGVGTPVSGLSFTITDSIETVRWSLTADGAGLFQIRSTDGRVSVAQAQLDYETTPSYILTAVAVATKSGDVSLTTTLMLTIQVIDVLEALSLTNVDSRGGAPQVLEGESTITRVDFLSLQVRDENNVVLTSGLRWVATNPGNLFVIDGAGVLRAYPIDHETTPSTEVVVSVEAYKGGGVSLTQSLTVTVIVANVLEEIILSDLDSAMSKTIIEKSPRGTRVAGLRLRVTDERGLPPFIMETNVYDITDGGSTESQVFEIELYGEGSEVNAALTAKNQVPSRLENTTYTLVLVMRTTSDILRARGITVTAQITVTVSVLEVRELILRDSIGTPNTIEEDAAADTVISGLSLQGTDEFGGIETNLQWDIVASTNALFAIGSTDGVVRFTAAQPLDYETDPSYTLRVRATQTFSEVSAELVVTVAVVDVLEMVPIADGQADTADTLVENATTGATVSGLSLRAEPDGDESSPAVVNWSLENDGGIFAIDPQNGSVTLSTATLNYEVNTSYRIVVTVDATRAGRSASNTQTLTIEVQDVIESLTVADTNEADNTVVEDAYTVGAVVEGVNLQPMAESDEVLQGAVVSWTLSALNNSGTTATDLFARTSTGALSVISSSAIDYETTSSVQIVAAVTAQRGGVSLSATVTLTVSVRNVLETLAIINESQVVAISESAATGTAVSGLVLRTQTDADSTPPVTITWSLLDNAGSFAIRSTHPEVTLSVANLDYETNPFPRITIVATASQDGRTVATNVVQQIQVDNALETVTISDADASANTIAENAAINSPVSGFSLQFMDDRNLSRSWTGAYSLVDNAGLFAVPNLSIGTIAYSSMQTLDYEDSTSHTIVARITITQDGISVTADHTATIEVLDVLEALTIGGAATTGTVPEDTNGAQVSGLDLTALDESSEPLSTAMWSITSNTNFVIDTTSGVVSLKPDVALDYEIPSQRVHTLTVSVTASKGGVSLMASSKVTVVVLNMPGALVVDTDTNDDTITENAVSGTAVSGLSLQATDEDGTVLTGVVWSIVSEGSRFAIDRDNGALTYASTATLDYETTPSIEVVVQAAAMVSGMAATRQLTVTIAVQNVLETVTISDSDTTANTITENAASGTAVSGVTLRAVDEGGTVLTSAVWSITSGDARFVVDGVNGAIVYMSSDELDYETDTSFSFVVEAEAEASGVTATGTLTVAVAVGNVFEEVRIVDLVPAANTLAENTGAGRIVGGIVLQPRDEANLFILDVPVTWSVMSAGNRFAIDGSGSLSYASSEVLDYETTPSTEVVVNAVASRAGVTVTGTLTVAIEVQNILEDVVVSDSDTTADTLAENAVSGTAVSGVSLQAVDERGISLTGVMWSITLEDSRFAIDRDSGAIRYASSEVLDRQTTPSTEVVVEAVASMQNVATITGTLTVTIVIQDVLEAVSISDSDGTANTIAENAASGTAVAGVSLQAADEGGTILTEVVWRVASTETRFGIDSASGAIRYATTAALDYETTPSVETIVQAVASKNNVTVTGTLTVTIAVQNVLETVTISDSDTTANTLAENAASGTAVAGVTLQAADEADTVLSGVVWSIASTQTRFAINSDSGAIRYASAERLDYETTPSVDVIVEAVASADSVTVTGTLTVAIAVQNVLETVTISDSDTTANTIAENAASGTAVAGVSLQAVDEVGNTLAGVMWNIPSEVSRFAIDSASGALSYASAEALDYETTPSTKVVVEAVASANNVTVTGTLTVTITVQNILEAISISDSDAAPNTLAERAVSGTTVAGLRLQVQDETNQIISGITWSITTDTVPFSINVQGEVLWASAMPPGSTPSSYTIVVQAVAMQGEVTLTTTRSVLIEILGAIDGSIVDTDDTASEISEAAAINTVVSGLALEVRDSNDQRLTDNIRWSLIDSAGGLFAIGSTSGVVSLSGALDYETSTDHAIKVIAFSNNRSIDATLTVMIAVSNVLETVVISDGDTTANTIAENTSSGTAVSGVSLQAADEGDTVLSGVVWSIPSENSRFAIDSVSGALTYASSEVLDHETTSSTKVVVEAVASAEGVTVTGTLTVTITVLNVLEAVSISDSDTTANTLAENAVSGTAVAGVSLQVADEGGTVLTTGVEWRVASTETRFAIDSNSGDIRYASMATLNYETMPSVEVVVQAVASADNVTVTGTLTVAIAVQNVLETVTVSDSDTTANTLAENAASGTAVAGVTLQATDENDTILSGVMFRIPSEGSRFAINSVSGAIRYASSEELDYEATPSVNVIVEAVASANNVTVTGTLTVAIAVQNVLETVTVSDGDTTANTIAENVASGTAVAGLSLQAVDEIGNTLTGVMWNIPSEVNRFAINSASGAIRYASSEVLDYETTPSTGVVVEAVASASGVTVTGTLTVTITVQNVLEALTISDSDTAPNTLTGSAVSGTVVAGLQLQAQDETNQIISDIAWSITTDTVPFRINMQGEVSWASAMTPGGTPSSYTIVVQAVAMHGGVTLTTTRSILIEILGAIDGSIVDTDDTLSEISEDAALNTVVSGLALEARDSNDQQLTDNIRWSLVDSAGGLFAIGSTSGVVSLSGALDYETSTDHTIKVIAFSNDRPIDATLIVMITVRNVLETVAISDGDTTANAIAENAPSGTAVAGVSLQAADEGDTTLSGVMWSIPSEGSRFAIDSGSGALTYASSEVLDYETTPSTEVVVEAVASADGVTVTGTLTVTIAVQNVLEAVTISDSDTTANTIAENAPSGTAVSGVSLQAADEGDTVLTGIEWRVASTETRFAIDSNSGAISYATTATLNYETTPSVEVAVQAVASANDVTVTGTLTVTIAVQNVLETVTISDSDTTANTITENAASGTAVAGVTLQAADEADTVLSGVVWSIPSENSRFAIDSVSGTIRYASDETLDYETTPSVNVIVEAVASMGSVTVTGTLTVAITVQNVLETVTISDSDTTANTIAENAASGTAVAGLSLQAVDEGDSTLAGVMWNIPSEVNRFAIDRDSGAIRYASAETLDYETTPSTQVVVEAVASASGVTVTGTLTIAITVQNVLEALTISDSDAAPNTLAERAVSGTTVAGLRLQARDETSQIISGITWSITTDTVPFRINMQGEVLWASATAPGSTPSSYTIVVQAVAMQGEVTLTTTRSVLIEILGAIDGSIVDTDDTVSEISEDAALNTVVSGLALEARDSNDQRLTDNIRWSLIDNADGLFAIGSTSGVVSLSGALDYETSTDHTIRVIVFSNNRSIDATLTVMITVRNVLETVAISDGDTTANAITENAPSGTAVSGVSLQAADEQGTTLIGVMWNITPASGLFVISSSTGAIRYASSEVLDYETTPSTEVVIEAVASAEGVTVTGTLTVTITVQNVLETVTISDGDTTANTLAENASSGTAVSGVSLQAADEGDTVLTGVEWRVASTETRFAIDSNSGAISYATMATLNYETTPSVEVVVQAVASANNVTVTGTLTVTIAVQNVLETVTISDSDTTANTIDENPASGTAVAGLSLQATDEVDTVLSGVAWSIPSENSRFAIDSVSGAIRYASAETLDYETTPSVNVIVEAVANIGSATVTGTLTVAIAVQNILETVTVSDGDTTANTIAENVASGTAVAGLSLQAADEGNTALSGVMWSIPSEVSRFAIDSASGSLSYASAETLDYETTPSTEVVVEAVASVSGVTVTGTLTVTIAVQDVLEALTISDSDAAPNTLAESAVSGTTVAGLQLQAQDETNQIISGITWSITTDTVPFRINMQGEVLWASAMTPGSTPSSYTIVVQAVAMHGGVTLTGTLPISIEILGAIDGSIVDTDDTVSEISEDAALNTVVSGLALEVRDSNDQQLTDNIRWSLVDSAGGLFAIGSTSGVVSLSGALDYETSTNHAIEIIAFSNNRSIDATLTVMIAVRNVLETVSISDGDTTANTLAENAPSGTAVSGVSLQAADEQGTTLIGVMWSIPSENSRFAIDSGSGALTYASSEVLDYETTPSTEVVVEAVASADGVTVTGTLTVTITVQNVLETVTISDSDTTANTIAENAASGTAVAGVSLQAADEQGTTLIGVMWNITPASGLFVISSSTGAIRYASTETLNYETTPSVEVVVQAVASANNVTVTGTLTVTIAVQNILETVTVSDSDTTANTITENASSGTAVAGLSLQAADEADTVLSGVAWSIPSENSRFAIDSVNGTIRYASAEALDYETTPSVNVIVEAVANMGSVTVTGTLTVAIAVQNVLETVTISDSDTTANTIAENASSGTAVAGLSLQAVDEVGNTLTGVMWNIPSEGNRFAIDRDSGSLSYASAETLDYETTPSTQVVVEAVASVSGVTVTGTLTVTITVQNVLETVSISDSDAAPNTLAENAVSGTTVAGLQLQAQDETNQIISGIAWSIISETVPFSINMQGEVSWASTTAPGSTPSSYTIVVQAVAVQGEVTLTTTRSVLIEILSTIEGSIVDTDNTASEISEDAALNTVVSGLALEARDSNDQQLTDNIRWSLADSAGGLFAIGSASGEVTLSGALDYETSTNHAIEIIVFSNNRPIDDILTVMIAVSNVLETVSISDGDTTANTLTENAPSGTAVSGVSLQAADESDTTLTGVMWSIPSEGSRFAIDSGSGALTYASAEALDYESTPSTEVVVEAVASADGVTVTGTLTVTITVQNVLETVTISDSDTTANTLAENASSGTAVAGVSLQAADEGDMVLTGVEWSVASTETRFAIDSNSGAISYATMATLNYETTPSVEVIVQAVASANDVTVTGTLTVTIAVQNVLETVTVSDSDTTANTITENASSGTAVAGLSLQAADETDTVLSGVVWSIPSTQTRFAIDSDSGTIRYVSAEALDYETTPSVDVIVEAAASMGSVTVTGTLTVAIAVQNVLETVTVSDSDTTANTIAENVSSGTAVAGLSLQAADERDMTLTGVMWNIPSEGSRFAIDSASGAIRYASVEALDYETTPSTQVVVEAVASVNNVTVTGTLTIAITVQNVLEALTISDSDAAPNTLAGNATSGTTVAGLQLQAQDETNQIISGIAWSITTDTVPFRINMQGEVSWASAMTPGSTPSSYTIVVQAVAVQGEVTLTTTRSVLIEILSTIEGSIVDTDNTASEISEDAALNTVVSGLALEARDSNDQQLTDNIRWSLVDSAGGLFAIGSASGEVTLSGALDYETSTNHAIEIIVFSNNRPIDDILTVMIAVSNVLETVSISDGDTTANTIAENAPSGTAVSGVSLQAADESDTTLTGVMWSIPSEGSRFAIDSGSGALTYASSEVLDYETTPSTEVVVEAVASAEGVTVTGTLTVTITVQNVLETVTISDSDTTANTLAENAASGTAVAGVSLQAADEGDMVLTGIEWRVASTETRFAIDSNSGAISYATTATLNYETTPSVEVVVQAVASANNVMVTGTLTVTIAVQNVLETVTISDSDTTANTITENTSSGTAVAGLSLQATDEADTVLSGVVWSIPSTQTRFAIDSDSGAIRYASAETLDYETTPSPEVVVQAAAEVSGVAVTGTLTVTITVLNVLETVTVSDSDTTANTISENAASGTAVAGLSLQAVDEGNTVLSGVVWSIPSTQTRFMIDSASGAIHYASSEALDYETTPSVEVVVEAVASASGVTVTDTFVVTITVNDVFEQLTVVDQDAQDNTLTENAVSGTAVTNLRLQAQDETNQVVSGVTWSITSDMVPFSISEQGMVSWSSNTSPSGTPSSYTIVVQAVATRDGVTQTGILSILIEILGAIDGSVVDTDDTVSEISEDAALNTVVSGLALEARDSDDQRLTDNIEWRLADTAEGLFTISSTSGEVSLSGALDYETSTNHAIEVIALSDNRSIDATLTVMITVNNVLETVAISDSDDTTANTITENAPSDTAVAGVSLQAADEQGTTLIGVMWNITPASGLFVISSSTGAIRYASTATLDYETTPSTEVVVEAVASAEGVTVTGTLTVTLTVLNVLETVTISDSDGTANTIAENAPSDTAVAGVSLQAADEGDTVLTGVEWRVASTATRFAIDSNSGAIRYASTATLNYETTPSVEVIVEAVASANDVTVTGTLTVTIAVQNVLETVTVSDSDDTTENTIDENASSGTAVAGVTLQATDEADTVLSGVVWSIASTPTRFAINSVSGAIRYASDETLDYEATPSVEVIVQAVANVNNVMVTGRLTVTIAVQNVLETVTISDSDDTTANTITENATSGTAVAGLSLQAVDEDDTALSSVMWSIPSTSTRFAINSSGDIRYASAETLDYEATPSTEVVVEAVASASGVTVTGTFTVTVTVNDVFEQLTVVDQDAQDHNTLTTNVVSGTAVTGLRLQAQDEAAQMVSGVTWSITSDAVPFGITTQGEVLWTSTTAPSGIPSSYTIVVQAVATRDGVTRTGTLPILIEILGTIEGSIVDTDGTDSEIPENAALNIIVSGLALEARDGDNQQLTSNVEWRLADNANGLFAIDSASGEVTLRSALDYETSTNHTIEITALSNNRSIDATLTIVITVSNVLETVAISDSDDTTANTITENAPNGTAVDGVSLQATDEGDRVLSGVAWSLASTATRFAIDSDSGAITYASAATLDYETTPSTEVVVQVVASADNVTVTGTLTVTLMVQNVLESVSISDSDTTANTIAENVSSGTAVGGVSLQAADEGGTVLSSVVWSVASTATRFAIDSASGAISYASTATLDYETTPSAEVVVQVVASADTVTVTGTLAVTIAVQNVLEIVTISDSDSTANTLAENAPSGTEVDGVSLQAVDEGGTVLSNVMWSVSSEGSRFAIDRDSGALSYASTATLDYETTPSTEVVVQVVANVNNVEVASTLTVTITVNDVLEGLTIRDADGADNIVKASATTDTAVAGLNLQALDENDTVLDEGVMWSLLSAANAFAIDSAGRLAVSTPSTLAGLTSPIGVGVQAVASKGGETRTATLTVMVMIQPDAIRLRLRLFLEGPLQ